MAVDNIARGLALRAGLLSSGARLEEHTTFHLDPAGDDRADGSAGDPWATTQHASDVLSGVDFYGYDITLQLTGNTGPGDFGGLKNSRASLTGLGWTNFGTGTYSSLIIRGNPDDATAVTLPPGDDGSIFKFGSNLNVAYVIDDITLDYTNPPANSALIALGDGVTLFMGDGDGGTVSALGLTSGSTAGDLINTTWNKATIWQYDTLHIEGGFDFAFKLDNGSLLITQGELVLTDLARWSGEGAFIKVSEGARAELWHSTTGSAVGPRFWADASCIDARNISGSGLTTLPGNIAGKVTGGGSYLSASAGGCLYDFANLPTADPHVVGLMWNNAGTPKFSAG